MTRASEILGALRRLGAAVGAAALVGLAAPACQGGDAAAPPGEGLGLVSQEAVGGCSCPGKGNCAALSYSDIPANNTYYLTSYGGGNETQKQSCPGMAMADGTWAYIADLARFGCGTKVKIEANGKSCITQVADCGPNRCVEEAAAYNSCNSHFPIIDASPLITTYLFGSASAGWSDKFTVKATVVGASTAIGCPGGDAGGGEGGSSGGQGGSGGSGSSSGAGGAGGARACERDSDCGGGKAVCDTSTDNRRCVTRKQLGESCSDDKECNGGLDSTRRVCEGGVCSTGCHGDVDCEAPRTCDLPQGKKFGQCKGGDGCTLDYPSVSILGIPAPARFTQSYKSRGCSGAPSCVIDINNIVDAKTRKKLSYKMVRLSEHFTLSEMTWQSAASSPYVYVDPAFMKSLEATRSAYGSGVHVNSGFRSPVHQNKVCNGICGQAYCPKKCARCSDHMGGQAADLAHSSPKCSLAKKACTSGKMHLIFNEKAGGDHLHVDIGSGNGVCSFKAMSCN